MAKPEQMSQQCHRSPAAARRGKPLAGSNKSRRAGAPLSPLAPLSLLAPLSPLAPLHRSHRCHAHSLSATRPGPTPAPPPG